MTTDDEVGRVESEVADPLGGSGMAQPAITKATNGAIPRMCRSHFPRVRYAELPRLRSQAPEEIIWDDGQGATHDVSQMSRRGARVAVFSLLVVGLAACGPSAALPLYEGPPTGEPRFSLLMGIEGELRLEGDCLILAAVPGSILLIWPSPGTQWDPTAKTVTLDDIAAQVGDRVIMGDYLEGQWPEDEWDGWVNKPSKECRYPMAMLVRAMRVR